MHRLSHLEGIEWREHSQSSPVRCRARTVSTSDTVRRRSLLSLIAAAAGAALSLPIAAQVDADAFIKQSLAGLQDQQSANDALWKMNEAVHWDVDQNTGKIVFSFADGKTATAPVQIVGTFDPRNGTFLWAWDHPAVAAPLSRAAKVTREWAERNNVERWTTRMVRCTESEAWEFTAVAARLDGATGAYRAPTGGPHVFLVFGKVTLQQRKPQ